MKKSRWVKWMSLLAIWVILAGCAPMARQVAPVEGRSSDVSRGPVAEEAKPAQPPESAAGAPASEQSAADSAIGERMIIRTVNMSMIVDDTEEALLSLTNLVKSYNGYIADSNKWYQNDRPLATITLRVPAASLDEVMSEIRGLALKVDSENSSGEDVTEEYSDLQARLRNLELTERELQALLTEVRENRSKAEDILAIYRELTQIRGQIEQLKGRQQFLERMSALATIIINIRPKELPQPAVQRYQWDPLVTASRALRSLVSLVQVLLDVAIYLIILSPLVLGPLFVIWLLVRLLRRGRKNKKETPSPKGS